ncbi:MFS transporter [Nocardioides jiangxiensis]|uniref:MFS transporter n=1 Tax=Nocardioides jiangxiensis TaxID=3064524 RepID=A0ABT9AZK4_9ACTN|nr:MFS transporter [Nocardioides sp. WY-20]MDO7868032.1 MFS transporter [Nocardioides sp. WY-20]
MPGYVTTRGAWGVVGAFSLVGAVTQLVWLTYAPITDEAAGHYEVSTSAIGWLANIFPLWYVLLAVPVGVALDRWLRGTVLVGALVLAAGCLVRLGDGYGWAFAGQTLTAIAQPLVVTAITPVAARYLPEAERPKAIALATASTFAGMIAAFVLATTVDLGPLLGIEAVVALLAAGLLAVAFRAEPAAVEAPRPATALADFRAAWGSPVVRRMCLLVPVPFGTFTALTTWAEPLLSPAGVTADQTGLMLMANVVAGVVACAVLPVWAAAHGRRRVTLLVGVVVAVLACVALAVRPSFPVGMVGLLAVGALLLPSLPIVLELSERAAPLVAGSAAGLVWLAGQSGALVVTGVTGLWLDAPAAAFLLLAAITAVALPLVPRREVLDGEPTGPGHQVVNPV